MSAQGCQAALAVSDVSGHAQPEDSLGNTSWCPWSSVAAGHRSGLVLFARISASCTLLHALVLFLHDISAGFHRTGDLQFPSLWLSCSDEASLAALSPTATLQLYFVSVLPQAVSLCSRPGKMSRRLGMVAACLD